MQTTNVSQGADEVNRKAAAAASGKQALLTGKAGRFSCPCKKPSKGEVKTPRGRGGKSADPAGASLAEGVKRPAEGNGEARAKGVNFPSARPIVQGAA